MTPQELKNSILQLAIQGKLVEQRPEEGTAEELYQQIQQEKKTLIREEMIKEGKPLPIITEDEKPFDIPESWKWVRIGNIVNRIYAGGDKPGDFVGIADTVRKYPVVANGIVNDGILGYTATPTAKANTITVAGRGTIGFSLYREYEYCPVVRLIVIEQNKSIYPQYLQKVLQALPEKSLGTSIPQLTVPMLYPKLIPLPPLAEQKRIVAKIEELLPLIDRYEKAWNRLEEFNKRFPDDLQKSLLQMAIQGKLVEQRPEEGTGEELYQQILKEKHKLIQEGKIKKEKPLLEITKDDELFEIPESWKWVSIGNACTNIQYGTSSKSSATGKMAVLRMGNIQNGRIIYDKLVYTSDEKEISKYLLEENDLLFNRTNSKELVGKTGIYKGEMSAIYAGYLVRITPVIMVSDFLNYVMQSQYYWNYCQNVRSDAIGQSNINAEKLKRFYFPLPPLAEQRRIVARLKELLPLCEKFKQ